MEDVMILAAGALVAFLMGYLKKATGWLQRQHDAVKAVIVFAIAGAVMYVGHLFGIAEVGQFPKAALAAMALRALNGTMKNVFNEPPEERDRRLAIGKEGGAG